MSDYHATYTVYAECSAGITIRLATRDTVRGGNGYQGVIQNVPGLGEQFVGAVLRAGTVSLNLAFATDDPLRAQVLNLPEGQAWTITTVCTQQRPGQAVTEIVHSRTMAMSGLRINGLLVVLTLADIDDRALETLHPPLTWSTEDWPQLDSDSAGLAIPDPVGVALHVQCPLLDADTDHDEWFYGVCTGEPVVLTIAAATFFPAIIEINGDHRDKLVPGGVFYWVHPSTAVAGHWRIGDVDYVGGNTRLLLDATTLPGSGWVGTQIRVMPQVLTVYRNGRVVPRSEYEIVHSQPLGPLVNGDFATGDLTGWTIAGSGFAPPTPTVVAGAAVISGNTAFNWSQIQQGFPSLLGVYHAVRVQSLSHNDDVGVELPGQYMRRVPSGRQRAVLVNNLSAPIGAVWIGAYQNTGTVNFDNVRIIPHHLVLIRFTSEQRDFQGSPYRITADIQGLRTRNAVREIERLLTLAGVAVNAASFNAASTYADTHRMLVDCDYGRDGQRTLRAILDDLCYIARATLSRNIDGEYVITQDRAPASLEPLDTAIDAIALDSAQWCPTKPAKVSISYRPGSAEPGRLQHTIERAVTGGSGGVQKRNVRYLRDHEAADRLLCYLQKRSEYARTANIQRYHTAAALGAGIELSSALLPLPMPSTTWRMDAIPQGWRLELREYNANIHVYTAAPLPGDADPGYSPDFSRTPPNAPTGLAVTSTGTAVAADGTLTARVGLTCTAPLENWEQIWFAAVHNVTGEIIMAQGELSGAVASVTLTGLRPGEGYQLRGWAVNAFGLRGPSATLAHTASGHATLPPDVPLITRNQGTGKLVNVAWGAVAITNLREYVLERQAGGGAWAEVWRGRANAYVDRDVIYGVSYAWRVKAVDTYGNASANWRTSTALTLVGNVSGGSGGDIGAQTVATTNRTNVSTVSQFAFFNAISQTFTLTHSLGRVPLVTGYTSAGHMVTIAGTTTTQVTIITLQSGWGLSTVDGSGPPHTHAAQVAVANKTIVVDFW